VKPFSPPAPKLLRPTLRGNKLDFFYQEICHLVMVYVTERRD